MSVNLQKGQKVDLTKGNATLKKIMVGLGWDEVSSTPTKAKGFLGSLMGGGAQSQQVDCDASAILCNANSKITEKGDVVYFGNLTHKTGAVKHMGDNLTGAGAGDDEQIFVNLPDMPSSYDKVVFVVNIYQAVQRKQHFGMIQNAFIRIVDADTNTELCKFNLSENYDNMTAMIFGEIYRYQNDWKFNAMGQPTTDPGLSEVIQRYS
ncbi:MAG: stress protein [Clostridiales bacterium GWE2_32_10]|nr:MAG: stress protein [Clostridiales bacterium GWE2_32_10]HBY19777.1 stress protein [Clostridiales bacterium]